jgi:two-component system response regulator HydG
LLVDHFLKLYCADYVGNLGNTIEDTALRALQTYEWPGNVRELENVIERASIIRENDCITLRDLPDMVKSPAGDISVTGLVGGQVSLEDLEKAHILQVLESVGGHKKRAAEILKINPSTLYRKLLRYGMDADDDEAEDQSEPADPGLTSETGEEAEVAAECKMQPVGPDGEAFPEEDS